MEHKPGFYKILKTAKELIKEGKDISLIEEYLNTQSLDKKSIEEIMQLIQPSSKIHKSKNGTMLILLGVVLLGFGFIASVLFTENEILLNISLYGITGVGAILLIIGLAMVFH